MSFISKKVSCHVAKCISIIIVLLNSCAELPKPDVEINVDVSQVLHTMQGGMGASWHSISKEFPLNNEKYKYPVREIAPRGSVYGGNPPVADTSAWRQVKQCASWLGMNFIRVELSQRMYEPEQGKFDWENEEMQALYLILDWCQQNDADVFLQQMWGYVEWNSYPGVHPLLSAPKDLNEFAHGITTLLEYLVNDKGYTCIKYFCMTNEPPGGPWGYWWDFGDKQGGTVDDAWKRLKETFDERGIAIPISGPDWTSMPTFDENKLGFAPYLGSIDIHSYNGVNADGEANLKKWAYWAHTNHKPFFLSEYGNMKLGWGDSNPGPKSFEAALSNANDVIRALRAGTDGVNRWSFTNRGDLDGQWQLIQTYDREKKEYLKKVKIENEAFYGFGIMSRFLSKYSSVVTCSASRPDSVLMPIALLSPAGELSIFILNSTDDHLNISLKIASLPEKQMNVYQVTKEMVTQPDFELTATQHFKSSRKKSITVPPKSITTVSSYLLENSDKGIVLK